MRDGRFNKVCENIKLTVTGVTIPRKRPKKTRNPEKDLKKTEKDFIFNRILFICYYNPIVYISMCSKNVYASIFYVNYRNTANSSLVCCVPDLLSFGTDAPPGELNIINLPGHSANTI